MAKCHISIHKVHELSKQREHFFKWSCKNPSNSTQINFWGGTTDFRFITFVLKYYRNLYLKPFPLTQEAISLLLKTSPHSPSCIFNVPFSYIARFGINKLLKHQSLFWINLKSILIITFTVDVFWMVPFTYEKAPIVLSISTMPKSKMTAWYSSLYNWV